MNLPGQPAGEPIGLPPEQFAAAFPFHFAVTLDLRFLQAGATLRRLCPDLQLGVAVDQVFSPMRPRGEISLEWVRDHMTRFFLLEHRATKMLLRGEFMTLPGQNTLLFLGSPWFTDSSEILELGLNFEDFAIHDPVADMLQVSQANKMALEDSKRLTEKLTAQRAELREVNENLRRQEAETRTMALIAARTSNGVVLTDAAGRIVWVNAGFSRISGYELADIAGKKPGEFLQGPGTDTATVKRISERLHRGEGFSEQILNYGKDGRPYWLSVEVQPIHDDEGRLTNFMAIQTDITEPRAAEQRLAIQFEISCVLAETNNLTAAVPRLLHTLCTKLGCAVSQLWRVAGDHLEFMEVWHLAGANVAEFIAASHKMQFVPGFGLPGRAWEAGRPVWISDVTGDIIFPRKMLAINNGLRGAFAFPVFVRGAIWGVVEFFSRNIEEPDEALIQTFAAVGNQIGQFIVSREVEEALEKTNALQRAMLNSAGYAIIACDPQGVIQLFNPAAERMLGYSAEEMVGKQTPGIFHAAEEVVARAQELTVELGREIKPGFEAFVAKAQLGRPDQREWTYIGKDGGRFPVLLSVSSLVDEQGRITGSLGVATDLTEQKRNEEKLRQTLTELAMFNRVMVNREERVLELKREINQIRITSGQPPAYPSALETTENENQNNQANPKQLLCT